MSKRILIFLVVIVLVFGAIQFIRPERNVAPIGGRNELFFQVKEAPVVVKSNLINACYNCHSNRTNYPWYASVAPVSWLISNHINEAKHKLNFSEWHTFDAAKQLKLIQEVAEVIEEDEMPPAGYRFMHAESNINDVEKQILLEWIQQYAETLGEN